MKIVTRILAFVVCAALWSYGPQSVAAAPPIEPFSQAAFEKAQNEGKVILLDFYASWCPTCRKQHAVLPGVLAEESFKDLVSFEVDFDNSAELQKALKVGSQSTFVVFKGKSEVARATALTDPIKIKELLLRACQ